ASSTSDRRTAANSPASAVATPSVANTGSVWAMPSTLTEPTPNTFTALPGVGGGITGRPVLSFAPRNRPYVSMPMTSPVAAALRFCRTARPASSATLNAWSSTVVLAAAASCSNAGGPAARLAATTFASAFALYAASRSPYTSESIAGDEPSNSSRRNSCPPLVVRGVRVSTSVSYLSVQVVVPDSVDISTTLSSVP